MQASPSAPSMPKRKYGTLDAASVDEEDAVTKPFLPTASGKPARFEARFQHDGSRCETKQQTEQWRRLGRRWRNVAASAALAIGAAAVVGYTYTAGEPSSLGAASLVNVRPTASASSASVTTTAAAAGQELAPLSFDATNFYHLRDGKPALDYPWLKDVKLIEPYRETTLSVFYPRDGHEYIWEVRGGDSDELDLRATASGAEAVVILTELDENMVTVKEVNSAGDVVRQLQERIMVKYVRREIRTLTDEEREELFDAMYQLWAVRVDGGNGKELYGENYADIYAINRLHFKAGCNKTCDHFHDGLGFLTTHSLLSNTFEYSLQRVNPKLTLPYWDWTIEELEAQAASVDGEIVIKSPLFQETWFGTADPDDYVVKDSRWAFTESPSMYDGNPGNLIPDVYGRLRSRWNVNPSPYITRGLGKHCDSLITDVYPWPTCDLHLSLVTDYSDWYGWVYESQHAPHGFVHVWIGGMLNCEETLTTLTSLVGKENTDSLKLSALNRKAFWDGEYFECEGAADADVSVDEIFNSGQCGCLGYDLSQGDDWKTIYYNSTAEFDSIIGDYDDDTKRAVVKEVCASTIYLGEHVHAGSSPDPSFWPMHPTMERLFMFSVLTGQITDMSWPDNDSSSSSAPLNNYGDDCVGHGGSDVFPFGLLETDIDGFEVKTGIRGNPLKGNVLTNREVLAALDANINMLPYVYDTFKWDHCLSAGVNFDDAWDSSTSTADTTKANISKKNRPSFKQKGLLM
ncbi:unnamed protein product [Pylaiella littoralis]